MITATCLDRINIRVQFLLLILYLSFCFGCKRKSNECFRITTTTNTDSLKVGDVLDVFPYLPRVICLNPNDDTISSLLFSSESVARFDGKKEELPYVNCIQIIDAYEPWPPRWYTSIPVYTDEMFNQVTQKGEYRYDFLIDPKVEAGYLSFYKILSKQKLGVGQLIAPDFAGYILLNKKMESVDTVKSNTKRSNLFFHDLRINANRERMVDLKKDMYLDLRDYTDNPNDTSVHCNVDYIHILDSNDRTIFTWNPLHHLNPEVFNYKETTKKKAFAANHSDMIEWTRLTSALWDYDGDIMYAMKQIGIGKVSRKDGHVIWQINNASMPIVLGKDTLEWYYPHDLNILSDNATTVTYSLYSNGMPNVKPAGGVVFEMDKRTLKIKSLKYIWPKTVYISNGQGNIEYFPNGDYAMGYGFFEKSDTNSLNNYRNVFEYQLHDGHYGIYQLPQWNYTYKARLLRNWPRPPRPIIAKNGEVLEVTGEMKDFTWYKISGANNRTIQKVGKGKAIKPEKGATYCVEGKYGIGFSVSRVFKN